MTGIVRFFAKEHLLGNLLTFVLLLFGIASLILIRREIWPSVDFDTTTVVTSIPGASPSQVENLIVNPIEEALREVEGIKKVFSTATEGTAVVVVQLDPNARDNVKTNRDLRSAVDSITTLPSAASDPLVKEANTSMRPVIELAISGGGNERLTRQVAKNYYEKLTLLKGVGKVTKSGYLDKEIHINTNPARLAKNEVSLIDIVNAIKANNITLPSGHAYNEQNNQILLKTESELKTLAEIENTVIKANFSGFSTKIKDVATVKETFADPSILYKTNGQKSINLLVLKKSNADALKLVERLTKEVQSWGAQLPDGITVGFTNDFSQYLKIRLNTLSSNLLIGLLLVIIVLTLFLPWQVTLVVSLGLPIALLSAVCAIFLMGSTINLISLIGLIIVLGMLVDDAIVVSENIWRHVESGLPMQQAVVTGTMEVFGPVLASVLTTVCAFAPMLFMTGIFGKFIYEIPQMVIIALFFSLFEAFIIMPAHFVSWVGPSIKRKKQAPKLPTPSTRWYDKYVLKYNRYVRWTLSKRYQMLGVILTLFVGIGVLLKVTGRFILFPSEGERFFFVQVEGPKGMSLEQMSEKLKPIEKTINNLPASELKDFVSIIGLVRQHPNDPQTRRGSNYANIRVTLTPKHTRQRSVREISEEVRKKIGLPEGLVKINVDFAKEGPPQGRALSINILGKDFKTLTEISEKISVELLKIEGVTDLRDSYIRGKDEWQVLPRSKDVVASGLSSSLIAQTLRASFAGLTASTIRDFDEEIDILVKQVQLKGPILEQLKTVKVGNSKGNLISLSSVADFKKSPTMSAISHINFKRVVNISGDVDTKKTTANATIKLVAPQIKNILKNYPNYEIKYSGESEDTQESMQSLGYAFIVAATLIFCLLIVTFKSFVQPVLILTSVPLGFMGVSVAMAVHNRPFSFMALLGVIALAGVIVNNSIVMIDFVNKLRARGGSRDESIIEAATTRLRPIVLTTTTTVCGLLPTAYGGFLYKIFGVGGDDPFIVPLALSLGWGLAFGSILTGLFFPSFIAIADDVKSGARRLVSRCF